MEGCRRCTDPAFCEDLISILAKPEYNGISPEILRNSLGKVFFNREKKASAEGFHIFHGDSVNRPSTDKASWTLAGLRSAGNLPEISCGSLSRLYREDIYMAAVSSSQ